MHIFSGFLDRLRIELRLSGQLQGLGIDKGLVSKLLETRVDDNADGLNELRLDLSPMRQVSAVLASLVFETVAGQPCKLGDSLCMGFCVVQQHLHCNVTPGRSKSMLTCCSQTLYRHIQLTSGQSWLLQQVLWLNNPEKDKQYKHLSSHIKLLLNMFPGRLPPMALNIMTLVAVGNPLSPESLALIDVYDRMHDR